MPKVSVLMPCKADSEQDVAWAKEAIKSVIDQRMEDWELIFINDGSDISLSELSDLFADPRVRGAKSEVSGVSNARNQAASMATAPLLLPLDSDDSLPENSLTRFLHAWTNGGSKQGVVYSDVIMFGQDFQRYYKPPEYDFNMLIRNTFMTVGCMHRKSDWEKSGGWKPQMNGGLEDWEYWITLGEMGVCGFHISEPLYHYRRHPLGRLAALRDSPDKWHAAIAKLRDLHKNTFDGRRPMGCCGGAVVSAGGGTRDVRPTPAAGAPLMQPVQVLYTGNRQGSFGVRGVQTRRIYRVGGRGTVFEAEYADVQFLLRINNGRDFRTL